MNVMNVKYRLSMYSANKLIWISRLIASDKVPESVKQELTVRKIGLLIRKNNLHENR